MGFFNLVCAFCIFLQVSPTYSREVSGNPVIAPYLYKFHGILNGIDPDIWDPYNDKFLPVSKLLPSILNCIRNKVACLPLCKLGMFGCMNYIAALLQLLSFFQD